MWSPSMSVVRVGLSHKAISIGKVPLLGRGRVQAVEHLSCSADPLVDEPWRAAVERLSLWLESNQGQSHRVQVVLSGRFVRWQLLPWRLELSGRDEMAAYAALRFRETYGKSAQNWSILPAAMAPGHTVPAAAVDRALLEALASVCERHGARLQWLTAYFSSAFDAWRGVLKEPNAWFGTVEADTLTLGLLQAGQWTALQSQRLSGDWRTPLLALLAQIAMACDVPQMELPLYLAGEGPAPSVATIAGATGDQAFTWLSPWQMGLGATPGLRLALGR
ncbi:hypothetical protein [Rhodoferax sp. GW822-FHT02A01]|uniref:hypothetical protein n=1 Tax=Rhodoferax sp. GW822-FHT02A01 TaxID=3141537 RepID=UPI00315CFE13